MSGVLHAERARWGGCQEGDHSFQASVEAMQRVLDLARVLRERHSKPLKQPLWRLTIVHSDAALLADLAGGPRLPHDSRLAILRWLQVLSSVPGAMQVACCRFVLVHEPEMVTGGCVS